MFLNIVYVRNIILIEYKFTKDKFTDYKTKKEKTLGY